MAESNPKAVAAERDYKVPLDLLEYAAELDIAKALSTGAKKYGRKNYQKGQIRATTYGAAMLRHLLAWLDGQDCDTESGLRHIAHIGANVHVLYGAIYAGSFVDDRDPDE